MKQDSPGFMAYLWSAWCGFRAGLVILLWGPVLLIWVACAPQRHKLHHPMTVWLLQRLYWGLIWAAGLRVEIVGTCATIADPAVWVANHQSALDIPLVGAMLGKRPHIWYALESLFAYPVLGWFLRAIAIPINQDNPMQAGRAMLAGVARARSEHLSTVLFPEGGRYCDGTTRPFMRGFVKIAQKLQQPIVPIYLSGLAHALPPKSCVLRSQPWTRTKVTVACGEPMYPYAEEGEDAFVQRVFAWFEQHDRAQRSRPQ